MLENILQICIHVHSFINIKLTRQSYDCLQFSGAGNKARQRRSKIAVQRIPWSAKKVSHTSDDSLV